MDAAKNSEKNKRSELHYVISKLYSDKSLLFNFIWRKFHIDDAPTKFEDNITCDLLALYENIWQSYCKALYRLLDPCKESNKQYIVDTFDERNWNYKQIANEYIILNRYNVLNQFTNILRGCELIGKFGTSLIIDESIYKLIYDNNNEIRMNTYEISNLMMQYSDNIQKQGITNYANRRNISNIINEKLIENNLSSTNLAIFHDTMNENENLTTDNVNSVIQNINSQTINTGRILQRNQKGIITNENDIYKLQKQYKVQEKVGDEIICENNHLKQQIFSIENKLLLFEEKEREREKKEEKSIEDNNTLTQRKRNEILNGINSNAKQLIELKKQIQNDNNNSNNKKNKYRKQKNKNKRKKRKENTRRFKQTATHFKHESYLLNAIDNICKLKSYDSNYVCIEQPDKLCFNLFKALQQLQIVKDNGSSKNYLQYSFAKKNKIKCVINENILHCQYIEDNTKVTSNNNRNECLRFIIFKLKIKETNIHTIYVVPLNNVFTNFDQSKYIRKIGYIDVKHLSPLALFLMQTQQKQLNFLQKALDHIDNNHNK